MKYKIPLYPKWIRGWHTLNALLFIILIVTGICMQYTDLLHITMGFFLSLFMIVHIYTCTLGSRTTSLFKSMITGYHEADEDH